MMISQELELLIQNRIFQCVEGCEKSENLEVVGKLTVVLRKAALVETLEHQAK
jgi:hypothetical protein